MQTLNESEVTFAITEGTEERPMFEEFFVLGLANPQDASPVATVLFQYPKLDFLPETLQHKVIPEFCYPLGCVAYPLHLSQSGTALNELIYGRESLYRSAHFFVFTLKANNSTSVCADWNKANKDRDVLYCICLTSDDLVSTDSGHYIYPKCLCLLSYYPCFDLHFQVLTSLLAMKRIRRMSVSPGCTLTQTALQLMVCDDITETEIELLSEYKALSTPRTGLTLSVPVSLGNAINYVCPEEDAIDTVWCCPPLFSALSPTDLLLLLSALMLEQSIVFLSPNFGLLSSCM